MEREHGRIVSVSTETLGSTLTADVAAGATVLPVYDAAAFDAENGGSVSVNGAVLAYSTSDDDASTVTLTAGLTAAASEGDRVDCWNTLYGAAFTVKTAMVQLDGDDDNPDPIECTVPHFLADEISDGDRGGPGESVTIKYDEDEDEWVIADVHGLAGASGAGVKFCNTDAYTVSATGDQAISLSHTPIDGSLHVAWEGVHQPPSEWSLAGSTLTLPDPGGLISVGDVIDPRYAYRDGPLAPVIASPAAELVAGSAIRGPVSTIAIPTGAQAGDLMIVAVNAASGSTCSDARLSEVASGFVGSSYGDQKVYAGIYDGGGALAVAASDSSDHAAVALAVYRGGGNISGTPQVLTGSGGSATVDTNIPVVSSTSTAICVTMANDSLANAGSGAPTDWAGDVDPANNYHYSADIYRWTGDGDSPNSPLHFTGNVLNWGVYVFKLGG